METTTCLNCGTTLQGEHCHACGQPVKGLVRPLKSIIHDALDTLFEYDSRIWRTLPPLYLLPGRITRDYLAGRRVRYVLPFRLFFVLTVVTFLLLQWQLGDRPFGLQGVGPLQQAGSIETLDAEYERLRSDLTASRRELEADPQRAYGLPGVLAAERALQQTYEERRDWLQHRQQALDEGLEPPPPPARPSLDFSAGEWLQENLGEQGLPVWLPAGTERRIERWLERGARNIDRLEEEPERLIRRFFNLLPAVTFVLLPVFALLLKVFHLFTGRLYMEHVVVGLHAHSFVALAVLMGFFVEALGRWTAGWSGLTDGALTAMAAAAWWWIPLYLLLMQKRVYGQGWGLTVSKFLLLTLSYGIVLILATVVAVLISVVTA